MYWTTWTTAAALLPLASAFYPYEPKHDGKTGQTRRATSDAKASNTIARGTPQRSLTLPLRRVPLRPRENKYGIVNSADPKQDNSVAVDQDGSDISYMGAVTIGNSKEEYHLLLDSAASNTWVMGQECESEACGRHNTFGEGDSDTLKTDSKTFSITYGTGSVSGTTATDTIHIGSLSTSLTFGLATNVSQEFNAYPMDGILGLGKGEQASTLGTPQLIDTLFSSKLISSKLYGLHLSRAADGLNDGELTLGSVNEDRYSGDISWYPALDNDAGFWELAISDAGTDASMTGLTGKSAIIDTGTSFVFLPEDDADALHALIDGAQRDGETFSVPCSTTTFLQIKFGEQVYGVDPKDWVGGTTEEGCRSNIFARQTFGDDQWLLGDVFLKNVYAAFDLEKNRVGFGTNSGGDDGSSSSSSTSSSSSASASASATATGTSNSASSTSTPTPAPASSPDPGALLPPSTEAMPSSPAGQNAAADPTASALGQPGLAANVSTSLFALCITFGIASLSLFM